MSLSPDLAGVPGVPETLLSEALLATLPAHAAPAPWRGTCDAVVWMGRGGAAATSALAPALRSSRGLAVVGAAVRYRETPVGAYDEVLGVVGSVGGARPWGSVAFMAVDSPASVTGGRAHWAMPKTTAVFEGGVLGGSTLTARGAGAVAWQVTVASRPVGPRLPVRARGVARQVFPDGRVRGSRLSLEGRARPALVTVTVASEGPLASWLRPGRHFGAVLEGVRFTLAAPGPRGEQDVRR
jgi:hypothetical protein